MPDNPTCETCRFWSPWHKGAISGNCHRYAPRPGDPGEEWPETSASSWCGEHAPRAEAPVVGADFGAGDDRTVICVPTLAHYVSAAADHGATVEGPVSPGDSFTVGSVTWVFRPVESPDAPR